MYHRVGSPGSNLHSFSLIRGFLTRPEDKIATFGDRFPSITLGALLLFSHPAVSDSATMDCSPPGSSAHGISQAGVPEQVAISFPRGSSRPRDQTPVSCTGRGFFITESPGKPLSWILTCWEPLRNLSVNLTYDGLTFDT